MANPTVNITNKQNASEPSTQGAFLIQRSGDNLSDPLTVKITIPPVTTLDGSTGTSGVDYQALPTSVTFAAGQDSLELPVIPIDDNLPESAQSVKVSLVADAAYTIGANRDASVLITDDEVVSVIPPGITKTAAEAGYTIKKLTNTGTGSSYYDISGSQAVWQEGAILDGSLWLFNGTETKKLSTGNTSPSSQKYGVGSLVTDSASIDNGRVVWQQRVDETAPYVGTIGVDHTFFYDGNKTIDLGKGNSKDKPNIAGDRVVWTADDGIHVYSISTKTNILIPDSKDAVNVESDADNSISWSQKVDTGRKDGRYPLYDQVLKLYDGTQVIEVTKLDSGTSAFASPGSIQSFVSNNKVVWSKASSNYGSQELFLYDGSKNIKISEDLGVGNVVNFGIEGDRVFYRAVVSTGQTAIGRDIPNIAARFYNIASGTTESVFEKSILSSDGIVYNMPNSDGKNTAWTYSNFRGGARGIYLDDGTTRVSFQDPTPGDLRSELFPEVSGSNVIFGINTAGKIGEEFYLATKDNVNPVATEVPTISIATVDTDAAETIAGAPPNPASINLKRTGDISKSLVVYYQVSNTGIVTIPGVPTNGVDYELLSGKVTFAAGSADTRVDINVIGDTLAEGDESLQFNLIADSSYVFNLESSIARLVITDNEVVTPPTNPEPAPPTVVTPEVISPVAVVPDEKPPVVVTPDTVVTTTITEPAPPTAVDPEVVTPEILVPIPVESTPIKNNNPAENERNPVISNPEIAFNSIDSPIPGITVENNLFKTSATTKGFGISAVSQKATNKVNEIGIFAVDDASGKIGSIAPGTPEYLKAALDIAKPIFTSLAGDFLNKVNQEFSIDPNKTYQFFEIQDGSISSAKQQIAGGKIPTNLLFSTPDANGNSQIKVTSNSNNDGYKVSVNADELVLNVVKLAGADVNSPIGTKSQTAPEGRTIDLTDFVGQTLKADITTTSSAAYTNNIGFYAVEDSIGTIKLADGSFVKPGDANYAIEAIKSALTNSLQAGKTDSKLDQSIAGGKIYAPVVVTQGTFADFAAKNPTNIGGANNVHAYFNYLGANSDNVDHFRLIGNNTFGVEDMYGGGDRDFNDLVVKLNVTV